MGLFLLEDPPVANDEVSRKLGRTIFEERCVSCHGIQAEGNGPLASTLSTPPTNFRDPAFTKSDSVVAARITYGKGDSMPAFVDQLSSTEIWQVAYYIASLRG